MNEQFIEWLNREMNQRGMGVTELGRRAGVSHAAISHLLGGKNNPSHQLCAGIAKAFGMPTEDVYQRAGILPKLPEDDETIQRVNVRMRTMLADRRGRELVPLVEDFVDMLYRRMVEAPNYATEEKPPYPPEKK